MDTRAVGGSDSLFMVRMVLFDGWFKTLENIMSVKTATFHGRKYTIYIGQDEGQCDQYNTTERFLEIHTDLNTKKGITTAIHEALHAENWAATEEVVDRVSTEIGRFLWRLGYRIQD